MERLMAGASSVQMVLEVQRSCSEGLHVVTVLMSSKRLPFDCVWAHFECWMQSRRLQQRLCCLFVFWLSRSVRCLVRPREYPQHLV
ncbi:hypothetical protein PI124_g15002 [Phytophthora idaei]|nr:hypothetical protein PI126_g13938 [Phytophthora idaei]KAG3240087.1 hypothetical protein PI124_g15002 [Phytophthora idaei]